MSDEERDAVSAAKLPLYLNRAMAKLKLGLIEAALWDCDQSLLIDPNSAKGHYRRARVYAARVSAELAKQVTRFQCLSFSFCFGLI